MRYPKFNDYMSWHKLYVNKHNRTRKPNSATFAMYYLLMDLAFHKPHEKF